LDELVSLAMFARVVEAKSFTHAATALGVSKSIVSKRVSALEESLGARLLHRTTRRLSLSPEGARLYERCMQMLHAADEAPELVRGAGDEPRGVLRVTSPFILSDAYLADAIVGFLSRYPHVEVELEASNAMVDLVGGRVDVALRLARTLESSNLIARRLATTPNVVCAAPGYWHKRGTPLVPDDLRAHACLRFSLLPAEIEWRFRVARADVVVPVSGPFASNSPAALRRAALAEAGVVVLPHFFLAEDLAEGRLVPVLTQYPVASLALYAVYAKGKFVPTKVRKFVDHLAATLRSVPGLTR
jgi:DNA-binding transcriptional LysR family regulator